MLRIVLFKHKFIFHKYINNIIACIFVKETCPFSPLLLSDNYFYDVFVHIHILHDIK